MHNSYKSIHERKPVIKSSEPKIGTVFEKDGKKREVVALIPGNRYTSPAVTWRRPDAQLRATSCSLHTWLQWVEDAELITPKSSAEIMPDNVSSPAK